MVRLTSRSPGSVAPSIPLLVLALAGCFSEPTTDGVNVGPIAVIETPVTSVTFRGGDSLAFSGSATDPEDGEVPAARLTWWVELHHDTHVHPFLDRTAGSNGKVFIPPLGHPDQNIFLRFYLEAMDQGGEADTVFVDLQPAKVTFAITSEPAGLEITLDGQPQATPEAVPGVVGMEREIGAPSPQTIGTTVYEFVSWSDGGTASHRIAIPEDSANYLARFRALPTANRPPTVSLTAPVANASVTAGSTVTLTATASDPDGSVRRVRFLDGTQLVGEDLTAPFSVAWIPTSAGSHTLTAQVTDNLGATVTSNAVTVTVTAPANAFPTARITAPAANASLVQGTAVTITATASDPDGSIVKVGFYDAATLLGEDTSAPWSLAWTPASTGAHAITARATDNSGFVGTSPAVNVTVIPRAASDNQAPTLTLTSPSSGTTGLGSQVQLTVTASDNVGVTRVEYQVDGEAVGEVTSSPWSLAFSGMGNYTTGVHVVRARARDAAGNVSAWSAARVTTGGSRNLPAGFSRTVFARGLRQSPAMAFAPDGRLFICEQGGALRVVKNGALLSTPFTTVPTTAAGERGLLGIAFHPRFQSNGYVYVYYTSASGGAHNRISRFTANGDVAVPGSEVVIADLPPLSSAQNHNGGALHFGPDERLYVAVGDNADGRHAPDLGSLFGKILRYTDTGGIPADNPYANSPVWARGLRNPFTFAFDPATAVMFINDVGQGAWEEVNRGRSGANYGWPATEGSSGTGGSSGYEAPVFTYGHASNPSLVTGFAIVGSAFYRPQAFNFPQSWAGHYFFGDYVSGWVNRLDPGNGNAVYAFARFDGYMSDLAVGPDGALYVLADIGAGWEVHRYAR